MAAMRSERARARARNLLATVYPIPDDAEFRGLRELAIDYIREAERVEEETRRTGSLAAAIQALRKDVLHLKDAAADVEVALGIGDFDAGGAKMFFDEVIKIAFEAAGAIAHLAAPHDELEID